MLQVGLGDVAEVLLEHGVDVTVEHVDDKLPGSSQQEGDGQDGKQKGFGAGHEGTEGAHKHHLVHRLLQQVRESRGHVFAHPHGEQCLDFTTIFIPIFPDLKVGHGLDLFCFVFLMEEYNRSLEADKKTG